MKTTSRRDKDPLLSTANLQICSHNKSTKFIFCLSFFKFLARKRSQFVKLDEGTQVYPSLSLPACQFEVSHKEGVGLTDYPTKLLLFPKKRELEELFPDEVNLLY